MWFQNRRLFFALGFGLVGVVWVALEPRSLSWGLTVETDAPASIIWEYPVIERGVLRDFYSPNGDYSAGHRGIDFESFDGETVLAPAAGTVRFAGMVAGRSVVSLDLADGVVAEVEPVCPTVAQGEPVTGGQVVGSVCSNASLHCEVPCLHLSARRFSSEYSRGFIYLSPLTLLGSFLPSRLTKIGSLI